jgi:pimeloyl-ACP methyl ester carboxylesterase
VVRGVPVEVEIHGTGTPLLAIHGWGVDRRLMTGCMEPLFDEDAPWQRIYPDLPGMGGTPGDPTIDGSDAVLALLGGLVDAIAPGQPFAVAGESYGGYLARGLVHARPDDILGMALICPSIAPNTPADAELRVLERDEALLASLDPADRDTFTDITVRQTRLFWERFSTEILPGIRCADQTYLSQVLGRAPRFSFEADDRDFDRPVLFLTGRQDSSVGYRRQWEVLERYPRASFVVLDRAGHNLQTEQPEVFAATVREWLERVELDRVSRA